MPSQPKATLLLDSDKPDPGVHNADLAGATGRLLKGSTYKDCSTIIVMPTRGMLHIKVVMSWLNLMMPMNQKTYRMPVLGHEVGIAYNQAIEFIINEPNLKTWKYVLTLEEDNIPPADGIFKLIEAINAGPFSAVGGLYWTKGPGGQPMIYGNPSEMPRSYRPQVPIPESVQECLGLGMGFTLFKMDVFRDPKIEQPWFRTVQEVEPGVGMRAFTQDLYFFEKAAMAGHRFACDTRVRVGHLDPATGDVW